MTNKNKKAGSQSQSPRASRTKLPPNHDDEGEEEEDDDLQPNPNRLPESDDDEDDSDSDSNSNSDSHNPNSHSLSKSTQPTLHLTSFSHKRGPLHPKPQILIDLRTLPNPPKDLRATQTGLSKTLRGWLVQNGEFKKRFGEAVEKIEGVLREREEGWKKVEEDMRSKGRGRGKDDDEEEEDGEGDKEEEMDVRVGVRCEMGRHRSVAFVEELSRYRWSKAWHVVVEHRDVDVERTRESMKGAGRRRGKNLWVDEE